MNKWEDVTSYSQRDTVKRPSSFKITLSDVSLIISYKHMDCPNEWVYRIQPFDHFVTELDLKEYEDMERAKEKAMKILKERMLKILEEIDF